jgi:hypothetical protein
MGGHAQAHALSSEAKDTLNTRVVPIVMVPGVMGTRLDIAAAGSDWDPDDTLEMAGWLSVSRRRKMRDVNFASPATLLTGLSGFDSGNRAGNEIVARARVRQIALDQMDPRPPARASSSAVIEFWEKRGWGELVWSFYGSILLELAQALNAGDGEGELRPVYAVGYDWRQSNKDSAVRLIQRVNEILAAHPLAEQVIIVTHSMGGIVTRSALAQGLEPKVLGVVHTVMPADGAVVAYRRFLTGSRFEYNEPDRGLNQILGPSRLDYGLMQSVLRGPTELLPHEAYPEVFLRLPGGLTNTNLKERLREAKAFSRSLATRAHPRTFVLFGDGAVTDVEFDWTRGTATADGTGMQPMVIQKNEGDGTVPRQSARFAGSTAALGRAGFPVLHAECFGSAAFRQAVVASVRRLLTPG